MTVREITSELSHDIRAHSGDDRISPRYILSKLKDIAALLIKRENDQFRLFNQQDIWTTIDCLELQEFDKAKCCDIQIDKCRFMMRSVEELPEIFSYRAGPVIREVMSIDGSVNFLPTTPTGYKAILDREFRDKRLKYFWLENRRIVIPDSQVKKIKVTAYFRDHYEAKQVGCTETFTSNNCQSALDEEFQCPVHLLSTVKQECLNILLNSYKRVVPDELVDGNSNNKTSNA